MTKTALLAAFSIALLTGSSALAEEPSKETTYNQLLMGGGSSIKGFGETDQEVVTADIIFRHARLFFDKQEGLIRGRHEFWVELPASIILHDTDKQDDHDYGIIGMNFLAAFIAEKTPIGEPYVMIGGGPQYIMADIDGVGSDICGNYQIGLGTRFMITEKHRINLEIRYHHISNLGMEDPNVPLNSVKLLIGGTF